MVKDIRVTSMEEGVGGERLGKCAKGLWTLAGKRKAYGQRAASK